MDEATRESLKSATDYWHAGSEIIAAHGGFSVDAGAYMKPRAEALDKRWNPHTVYSCGVHYNLIGNQLIAGAVLTSLGLWTAQ